MAKSTKIIAALGVVAGLGVAALPMASYAAHTNTETSIQDSIEVVVLDVCKFTTDNDGITEDREYSKTLANGENGTIATHKFNVVCNDADGYTVKATASGLTDGTNNIAYADATNYAAAISGTAEAGAWTATVTGGSSVIAAANTETTIVNGATTNTSGSSFSVEYKAYVGTKTPAGTYAGTVLYTLAAK